MEIEKLIKHMREEAQDYRSGRTLGRAFADAEDVLDEAATALEQLQAENDRLRRETMIDQCYFCVFGPKMLDKCEYYHLPESMRGECCQYWDLFRRFEEGVFDERENPSPTD